MFLFFPKEQATINSKSWKHSPSEHSWNLDSWSHAGQEPPPIDATYTGNEFQHWKRYKWRFFRSSCWAQRQGKNPIRSRSNLSVSAKLAVILQTFVAIFWMNSKMPPSWNHIVHINHVVYIYTVPSTVRIYIYMYCFFVHGFPPCQSIFPLRFIASTARRKPSLARSLSRAWGRAWFAIPICICYQCHPHMPPLWTPTNAPPTTKPPIKKERRKKKIERTKLSSLSTCKRFTAADHRLVDELTAQKPLG